ncbi:PREDICTED: enhancer of mRNA-decapping protein 3 [Wasmannia auropunctata]|uniref:enhancer of mRNA-decapping protein 3 n=1 Tax=Wasmannia auropunctata TaxID=64793 RepID=UPI0005EE8340|nr:PREDICTED: enhancer of mRNA-decapping protein 3 [Wasmannia auropunctata]XP_011690421.1 PREDICTED: enhancer of mRNA-decapping protein 3 [Wasmannia auropunctata]XP_011690422.1 PREDICTED: enhancer of mRNA-decapping protein 3 [Wasmannia auropunctata]XP_011690423.1 PREDICTED: enhancer of mRNA-decapping protein 3 [Wasmannia auropunctata]XP_011690424.1 PREDICTED: enhancer of mRNA-decapping protein 3 [Wasmannia auropunctata]XP_011690425.1 PREDICTED: enhancer of mRNA-decapping protein 3 [Wasmannia a
MSEQFLGCTVSVKCIDDVAYQGKIIDLNKNSLTLAKAFCNGMPHTSSVVNLSVKDIQNLEIISTEEAGNVNDTHSKVIVKRPIAKRVGRSISECVPNATVQAGSSQTPQTNFKKPAEPYQQQVEQTPNGKIPPTENNASNNKSVSKRLTHRQRALERDEHTFGTPIDQSLQQDFDFEKNLALFNKEAVWQEINSLKPDIVRQSESNRGTTAIYRPDENILVSEPTVLRQIEVPCRGEKEYVTDNGLVIPSITLSLHRQLIGAADRLGISWERRLELLGRAGAELTLQLLGGSHRLNPNNAHQWPTVVALCGPHRSGAAGINCARQLSSHGVKTIVFVENTEDVFLLQELSLYRLTENKVETKVKNLPSVVDLILVALCDEDSPRMITPIARWANSNRAPALAIEPPATGTPGILCKFSLLGALPLSHSVDNGRLYLCNLALPHKVYLDVGVKYKSPFGPKFVIPLHSNNS